MYVEYGVCKRTEYFFGLLPLGIVQFQFFLGKGSPYCSHALYWAWAGGSGNSDTTIPSMNFHAPDALSNEVHNYCHVS